MQEADNLFKSDDFMLICDFADMVHTEVLKIKRKAVVAFHSVLKHNSTILSTLLDRVLMRFTGGKDV